MLPSLRPLEPPAIPAFLCLLFLASALTLLSASNARARAQSLGVGPQYGYHNSDHADDATQSAGAALRLRMLSFLGIEGSINYREDAYGDDLVVAQSWPLMITGLVYPLPMIYGSYGAGWYDATIEYGGDSPRNEEHVGEFGWQAGAGIEIPLGNAATFTGEVRYMFVDLGLDEMPQLAGVSERSYFVTVGFLIALLPPESALGD